MKSKTVVLPLAAGLLSLASNVDAFWRMPCRSRVGLARLDPIMNPGVISDHVHAIHGGGAFSDSITPSELQSQSTCTSCEVTQDKSAYWTPSLHFMYTNGTTVVVPQVGGMLAYYLLYTDPAATDGTITTFPEGFQMVSGNKHLRNFTWPVPDPPKSLWEEEGQTGQFALEQKALGFNCLNYAAAPEGSLYRHFMPDKAYLDANCLDGIRLELMFPSCWNGVDLDSSNHRSHMAFPDLVMTGTCPEGFETKLPSLFYETIWDTYAFVGIDGEFLLSHGDPTGYGYHGDFMMGWEPDFLQSAIDTCTNASGEIQDCALFDIQTDEVAAECLIDIPDAIADDEPAGPRNGLAVGVPIQSGPAPATDYAVVFAGQATAVTTLASSSISSAIVPTLSYSSATALITDDYGTVSATGRLGNAKAVTKSTTASSSTPVSEASTATASSPATSAAASSEASTATASSPATSPATSAAASSVASSAITAAPSVSTGSTNILSTSTWTSANAVIEMVIEQVVITVTATETVMASAAAYHKRHLNQHLHGRY